MEPNKERVAELKKNPFVAEWIDEYQTGNFSGERHPDCPFCGWPHARIILCGSGATFGKITLGGNRYGIDACNVEYMLGLVDRLGTLGFHWKNEIFFDVEEDIITVTRFDQYDNCPHKRECKIPQREWQSIVDFIATKSPAQPQPATGRTEAELVTEDIARATAQDHAMSAGEDEFLAEERRRKADGRGPSCSDPLCKDPTCDYDNEPAPMADGRGAVIEECAKAAQDAQIPSHYRWGHDAMEQFNFGKIRAAAAIRALQQSPATDAPKTWQEDH